MKSRVLGSICLLLACIVLCIGANFLAFTIDTPDMRQNAWQGCLMLGDQLGTPQTVGGFLSSQMDNYTSILILKTAAYTGEESLLAKALGGLRVEMGQQPGQSGWEAFCAYGDGSESMTGAGFGYPRYWHGYTLPLRLALCVLDAANLQMFVYFVELALLCLILFLMKARGLSRLMPGFFLCVFLLMPFSMSICLQYMPVSLLMLVSCALILAFDDALEKLAPLAVWFAMLGIATNYLDLLTFPLVSMGFPLILLLAVRMDRGDSSKSLFFLTACCGCAWALGYGGMWALKWALNGMAFGWESVFTVFTQIGLRASSNGGELSRIGVLMENLNVILAKKSYLLLIGLCGLATLLPAARAVKEKRGLRIDLRALNLLLPAAAVCLWYIVMANHSHDHTYFTFRNTLVIAFSGFAFLACALSAKRGEGA
ncbi:MAG: hypothetical protein IKU38_01565 [Clostridia bacterium]|nr:hypothetical protein [Clostridia bacterium]